MTKTVGVYRAGRPGDTWKLSAEVPEKFQVFLSTLDTPPKACLIYHGVRAGPHAPVIWDQAYSGDISILRAYAELWRQLITPQQETGR